MQLLGPYRSSTVPFSQRFGIYGDDTAYYVQRNAAIAAARRNNASLWFAGAPADLAGFVWQDSAGTTPATGTDPIGLLLDRSYGTGNPGPELVLNGNFSSNDNWTLGSGAVISGGLFTADSQVVPFIGTQNTGPAAVIGKQYMVTFTVTAVTNASSGVGIRFGGAITQGRTTVGTFTEVITAVDTSITVIVKRGSGAWGGSIDSISVREVLGIPALQATAANKPTLELQANGFFGMRFDGADDVLQHSPIAQPPANITAIFSGVRPAVLAGFDVFWAQAASGASEGLPYLGINTSRNLVGQVSGGAGAVVNVQDAGVTADGERFVAAIQISAGELNLLKNGALVSSAPGVSGVYTTATNASIGAILRAIPGSYMNGICSLVCVSNNAMSAPDRIAIERFAALLSGATYA